MTSVVPVFYATTEGQTCKIARYLASSLRTRGVDSVALEIGSPEVHSIDWSTMPAAIVGASIHIGAHQKQVDDFLRHHRDQLNALPTAFYSVSLSAASAHAEEVAAARDLATSFVQAAGWQPDHVVCFAGCLAYTKYGPFKRLLLKRIARKEGASTDTSRDHEYTDWGAVDRLADLVAASVKSLKPSAVVA